MLLGFLQLCPTGLAKLISRPVQPQHSVRLQRNEVLNVGVVLPNHV